MERTTVAKIKVSYKPLFKLLVDKNMRKKDLCALAGVSTAPESWAKASIGLFRTLTYTV